MAAMDGAQPSRLSSNITGISLHAEESGEQLSEVLTFHKYRTRIVNIGRRSSQSSPKRRDDGEVDRALFRCPVISRRHAKITFTEYGNVYIMDLNSHHGTHILRPGDTVSKMIQPDTPTVLADGDVVTFGKSVGRDEHIVRPVTVHVKLLFGGDKPLAAPDIADVLEKPSPSSVSGRYGVNISSSDWSVSQSDSDSDMEDVDEMPPPSPRHTCLPELHAIPPLPSVAAMIKQFLPPMHSFSYSNHSGSSSLDVHNFCFEGRQSSVDGGGQSQVSDIPSRVSETNFVGAWRFSPVVLITDQDDERHESDPDRSHASINMIAEEHNLHADASCRSPSSSSPANLPSATSKYDNTEVREVDDSSIFPGPDMDYEVDVPLDDQYLSIEQKRFSGSESNDRNDDTSAMERSISEVARDIYLEAPASTEQAPFPVSGNQLHDVSTEITLLRTARHNNEARFEQHFSETRERLEDLDRRVHDTDTRFMSATSVHNTEHGNFRVRLDALRATCEDLQAARFTRFEAETAAAEESMNSVSLMKSLAEEMKTLRDNAEAEVSKALDALKHACAEAETAATEVKAQAQATVSSLKRKRSEELDDVRLDTGVEVEVPVSKRMRTVAAKVLQTTAVAAVGAVAAWSALAFS